MTEDDGGNGGSGHLSGFKIATAVGTVGAATSSLAFKTIAVVVAFQAGREVVQHSGRRTGGVASNG
jgi:hypothetical protein